MKILRRIYHVLGLIWWDEHGRVQPFVALYCTMLFAIEATVLAGHLYFVYVYSIPTVSKTEIFMILTEISTNSVHLVVSVGNYEMLNFFVGKLSCLITLFVILVCPTDRSSDYMH